MFVPCIIISTDEDPSLRIESSAMTIHSAIINLRHVSIGIALLCGYIYILHLVYLVDASDRFSIGEKCWNISNHR